MRSDSSEDRREHQDDRDKSPCSEHQELPSHIRSRIRLTSAVMRFLSLLLLGTAVAVTWVNCRNAREGQRVGKKLDDGKASNRPKPDQIAQDQALRAFLQERFAVVSGNAPLEEAEVIGWGEMHYVRGRKDRAKLPEEVQRAGFLSTNNVAAGLRKVVRDGDHILLEGIGPERGTMKPNPFLHFSLAFVRDRAVTVSGWDDEKLITDLDEPVGVVRRRAMERNEKALIPVILQTVRSARRRMRRIHVIAGMGHFLDDPRIDRALEEHDVSYLLLSERNGLRVLQKLGFVESER